LTHQRCGIFWAPLASRAKQQKSESGDFSNDPEAPRPK
jgi:hypothetical protein